MSTLWQDKRKAVLFLAMILAGILLTVFLFPHLSRDSLQEKLALLGPWAVPLYILLFAILPGFLFPTVFLVVPAGAIFGFVRGSIYTMIGATINMAWMFLLARYLFREQVNAFISHRLSPGWQAKIQANSEGRKAFYTLLVLRVTPLIPYQFLNYAYGLSPVDFDTYMLASIIGVAPGVLVYLNLGDKAWNPSSAEFWIALSLFAVLILASKLLSRIFNLDK